MPLNLWLFSIGRTQKVSRLENKVWLDKHLRLVLCFVAFSKGFVIMVRQAVVSPPLHGWERTISVGSYAKLHVSLHECDDQHQERMSKLFITAVPLFDLNDM